MAQQIIELGAVANDGNGDTIRDGGDKINDNFTELYNTKIDSAPNSGFSGEWTFISSATGTPATAQFSTDNLTVSSITKLVVHRNANGLSFDTSLDKVGYFLITNTDGEKFIFEVSRILESTSYVEFTGYTNSGTLGTLSLNSEYNLSLLYGDPNYGVDFIPEYLKGVVNSGSDNSSLWLISPKAQHFNGSTYIVYIDFSDNKRKIAKYVHDNDEWTIHAWTQTSFVGGSNTTNKDYAHASPSLLIDSNGVIHITYTTAKNADVFYVRSTSAEDISSFNAEITIATGTTVSASYTSMIEHNSKVVMIYRGEDSGKSAIRRKISLDAGATWVNDVLLIENAGSDPNGRVYYQTKISKTGRLHLSFHDSSTPYGNHDLFHTYSDNISDAIPDFYTLKTPSTLETLPLSLTGNVKIYDSVAAGWDTCYMLGTAIDNEGDIHITTYVKSSTEEGELLHFNYNGSSWVNNLIIKQDLSSWTVGSVQGDIINHNGTLLLMTEYITDTGYGTYGKSEIKEFISFDNGATWRLSTIVTHDTPTTTANPFYIRGTRNIGWFEGDNDYGVGKVMKTIFR